MGVNILLFLWRGSDAIGGQQSRPTGTVAGTTFRGLIPFSHDATTHDGFVFQKWGLCAGRDDLSEEKRLSEENPRILPHQCEHRSSILPQNPGLILYGRLYLSVQKTY
ncbi:hypothetical protein P175DRAFT_0534763 [Aspergillus ochraceoroseus IBT 24754]|uniref:Uncharacterized protein n=1 Tax=Aspergillus ochraceoroseus IBT 24754 TaxID=1392256 RepID=A0A2T5LRR9_9EURO|nr:uncharacterized protein P175DRAFT_0534763 [Aspergillus ochraceoroseus IBT 24754]PTU18979.1 hypothetical protein P175DRAFT_0534763 [Aspergillus ochraceoroseus IBT 24754]